ncbi:hypothetical protein IHE44_0001939 [Lamprotornis superbus]|uniref:Phospholipid scramblase n=1 Tax=Lamprotornis superbus TaxID=245042 RepID=A0A835TV01_9PASS|nr:hypothetical protein IHE44_0001939 [Lamprotornis superbus]
MDGRRSSLTLQDKQFGSSEHLYLFMLVPAGGIKLCSRSTPKAASGVWLRSCPKAEQLLSTVAGGAAGEAAPHRSVRCRLRLRNSSLTADLAGRSSRGHRLNEAGRLTNKSSRITLTLGYFMAFHVTTRVTAVTEPCENLRDKPTQSLRITSLVLLTFLNRICLLNQQLDQIIIHQQVELLEAILGTETSSKYEIKNHLGQRVYFAVEENGCFDRQLCSPMRAFTMRIADNAGREVIRVIRPLRCSSCCFPCFLQELEVQSPPGTIAGYVVQNWDPFLPKFTIQNQSKEDVLKIIGPYATCGCFEDVDFEVKTLNEMTTIGKISKYWSGFVNNVFTNTANFGIQVPVDLDVRIKAVMIGACFLIVDREEAPPPGHSPSSAETESAMCKGDCCVVVYPESHIRVDIELGVIT